MHAFRLRSFAEAFEFVCAYKETKASLLNASLLNASLLNASLLAAALIAALMAPGLAAAQPQEGNGKPADEWRFTLGGAGLYTPDYEGSDDYEFVPLPLVNVSWRDTVSVGSIGGLGLKVKFLKIKGPTPKDRLVLSSTIGYFGGRDQDANDALDGLGDLDGGATLMLSADYQFQDFGASVSAIRDLSGDRDGTTFDVGLRYGFQLGSPKTTLTFGTSLTWADDNYMENMFGISATQAASSTLSYAAYAAGSGIKDFGASVSLLHFWTRNVAVTGQAGYKRLLSDAADSPLVDAQGSTGQFSAMIGVSYNW